MKAVLITVVTIVFIFISYATVSKVSNETKLKSALRRNSVVPVEKEYPPVPILKTGNEIAPEVSAESVFVVDVNSGVSLYEKNPDEKVLPASTTKIITAMVAMDKYNLGDIVRIGKIKVDGQKMGLVEGEEITVEDLLNGLLIYSANDAAEALAAAYPEGRNSFVAQMNKKALQLHLQNSNYTNPSGLDNINLTTSARDLAIESIYAMKIPFFRQVVGTKEKTVRSIDGTYKHRLTNVNELVGEVPGVLGIKTGWTENAKENLVSYVERNGHDVVFVVLKSDDRFGETKTLINWVFGNFDWKKVSS